MDKKFFVPFETAQQLKEKGYPQDGEDYIYLCGGERKRRNWLSSYQMNILNAVICPTYHEVLDWLENKDIIIESTKRWVRGNYYAWFSDVHRYDGPIETFVEETREEAIDQAIIYALELI